LIESPRLDARFLIKEVRNDETNMEAGDYRCRRGSVFSFRAAAQTVAPSGCFGQVIYCDCIGTSCSVKSEFGCVLAPDSRCKMLQQPAISGGYNGTTCTSEFNGWARLDTSKFLGAPLGPQYFGPNRRGGFSVTFAGSPVNRCTVTRSSPSGSQSGKVFDGYEGRTNQSTTYTTVMVHQ